MLSLALPSRNATVSWAPWDQRWYASLSPKTAAGPRVSEETAMRYSAVWAAVRVISTTMARLKMMPWKRRLDRGGDWLRDRPESLAMNLVANPDLGSFSLRSFMTQCQLNWGNGFAEIVRQNGTVSLYPIHPSRVIKATDASQRRRLYRVLGDSQQSTADLTAEEILHVPSCMADQDGWGMGVIQFARENLGTSLAAEKSRGMQFGANSIPPVVVQSPKQMTAEDRAAFRAEWRDVHSEGGAPVALLTNGATANALNISHRDMQHLELSYFGIEDVSRWYGIPLHMLSHLLKTSQNNIEELSQEFIDYCLATWWEPWKQELNLKLLNRDEVGETEWEVDDRTLRRGSRQSRATYFQSAITLGYMTRNEVREEEGYNPIEGGDEAMVQGAMIPASEAGRNQAPSDQSPPSPPQQSVAEQWLAEACARMVKVEANAIRRIAESPDKMLDAIDKFYAKHASTMVDAIGGAMVACGRGDAGAVAVGWCQKSRESLMEIAGQSTVATIGSAIELWIEAIGSDSLYEFIDIRNSK